MLITLDIYFNIILPILFMTLFTLLKSINSRYLKRPANSIGYECCQIITLICFPFNFRIWLSIYLLKMCLSILKNYLFIIFSLFSNGFLYNFTSNQVLRELKKLTPKNLFRDCVKLLLSIHYKHFSIRSIFQYFLNAFYFHQMY